MRYNIIKKESLNFTNSGFDRILFTQYLIQKYDKGFTSCFEKLADNICEYAEKHERVSKDQFAYFISDLFPDMEFKEAAAFCSDDSLTIYGIGEKETFWKEYGND